MPLVPYGGQDKPGPGRFREFLQFDIDSVGVQSEMADTEIMCCVCDSLAALGVSNYQVRFSSRRVLNLVLAYASIPVERGVDVFRVIDKLDKIGPQKLRLELTEGYFDESGARISGLGLTTDQVDRIEQFLAIKSPIQNELLTQLHQVLGSVPGAEQRLAYCKRSHTT
jgi:histidyl-tRNA synthetase